MGDTRRTVWLISIHFHGHIAPLVNLVKELQELDYDCVVISNDLAAASVTALLPAGARFLSTGPNHCSTAEDAVKQQAFKPTAGMFAYITALADLCCGMERSMCHGLWRLLGPHSTERRPDLIVCDIVSMAGLDAAEKFGIPAVGTVQVPLNLALEVMGENHYNYPSAIPVEHQHAVYPQRMTWLQQWVLNPLLKRLLPLPMALWGTPYRDAVRAEFGLPCLPVRTLFAPPRLPHGFMMLVGTTWALELPRRLPPGWHLCGPLAADFTQPVPPVSDAVVKRWCDDALATGRPLVLVTFGTLVRATPEQVLTLVCAMELLPGLQFLWGLQPECLPNTVALPGNVLCLPWVPQLLVLFHPACRLFVSHCGMSSMHEGAAAGVLMVGVPCGGDQPISAQHVVNQGRGLQVRPHEFQAPKLVLAIKECLASPVMQATCDATARAVCAESGPRNGARLIDEFVKKLR